MDTSLPPLFFPLQVPECGLYEVLNLLSHYSSLVVDSLLPGLSTSFTSSLYVFHKMPSHLSLRYPVSSTSDS